MAKYLLKVSYSTEGLQGVMKAGGAAREKAVEQMLAGVGGSLEAFYFAFGEDDVIVIADLPDQLRDGRAAGALRDRRGAERRSRLRAAWLLTPVTGARIRLDGSARPRRRR